MSGGESVDRLRQAAAQMRALAAAATPGPWRASAPDAWRGKPIVVQDYDGCGEGHQFVVMESHGMRQTANAAHVAAMHPAVALAVADWLDQAARLAESGATGPLDTPAALAVADAFLASPL